MMDPRMLRRSRSYRTTALACWAVLLFTSQSAAFVSRQTSHGGWTRSSAILRTASSDDDLPPIPSEWRGEVLQQLKTVIDPDLGSDIVTLGFVQNLKLQDRTVSFDVELTTPACPVKDQFAADCERLVRDLPFVDNVQVTMTAQETIQETETFGMSKVGAVIAVSSCKGGVGKSTTAVNLAYSLQAQGATVGIFDADFYGPSLPTMVQPDDDLVRFVGRQIAPLQRNGVRLMSFGYVNEGSAVMRGPMVTQLLDQFLSVTHWGSLDYLIIDMPPGTGDIQLTLTQRLNITAAVIVTTPTELSFADVVRGVEMFDSVQVPSVAVVENMAYYEVQGPALDAVALKMALADKLKQQDEGFLNGAVDQLADDLVQVVLEQTAETTEQIPIFGSGHKRRLAEQWGIEHTFSIPLLDRIASNGDDGTPFVLEYPDSPQAQIYSDLAKAVVSEVAKAKFRKARPQVVYDKDAHQIVVDDQTMPPATLRRACRCAACVEELTGRQVLVPSQVSENITPLKLYPTGNYALSVDWSDGHRSLYPLRQIKSILSETVTEKEKEETGAVA